MRKKKKRKKKANTSIKIQRKKEEANTWCLVTEKEKKKQQTKSNVRGIFVSSFSWASPSLWWVRVENTWPHHKIFHFPSQKKPTKTSFSSLFSSKFSILPKILPNKHTLKVRSCFFLGVEWLVRKGMRLDALKERGDWNSNFFICLP